MNYTVNENGILLEKSREFDLRQTLECGQCFRFTETQTDTYIIHAMGKTLKAEERSDGILLCGVSAEDFKNIWFDYFDLGLDYAEVKKELVTNCTRLAEMTDYSPGIRILKQEPWEALCSFIISQNNNIPRIKGIIDRLCSLCGESLSDGTHGFPKAERLAQMTAEELAPIRSGFRAKYIIDAARKVSGGEVNLSEVSGADIDAARKLLMRITGVGPKVAECTLLYGMHRLEAFPVDVWMKRAMQTYFDGIPHESFGRYAGIAQQYIFHYARQTGVTD